MSIVSPVRAFESLAARQDPIARLLLLLAKVELAPDQQREARALARQVHDWEEFMQIAVRKFAVTYAQLHLQAHAADEVPASVMERLRTLARATVLSTLRVVAAQVAFHKSCIARTGVQHVYLKGVALAQQYSGTIGARYCRDIDVLIASRDFSAVLTAAVSEGYRVLLDDGRAQFTNDVRDLGFLSRYADVVTLIGPDSIPIEVHRRLDKLSLNFDLEHAFASAENVEFAGITFRTLSKPLHFIYICYHHSRHFWSHLHWLADLDALARSPDCDPVLVRKLADSIGIRPTIDAALEFHELVSRPGLWGATVPVETAGGQFLKACLVNLDGNLDLEVQLRKKMTLNDFMSAWQVSPGRYHALWFNSWLSRLRPSVSQYVASRYPAKLYWIYSLENAADLVKNGLVLAGGAMSQLPRGLARMLARSPKSASE